MRIENTTVYLHKDEVSKTCPADPRWAVKALKMYGLREDFKSAILREAVKCPQVLEALGYKVIIEKDTQSTEGTETQG